MLPGQMPTAPLDTSTVWGGRYGGGEPPERAILSLTGWAGEAMLICHINPISLGSLIVEGLEGQHEGCVSGG